jgi:hypothetical protein
VILLKVRGAEFPQGFICYNCKGFITEKKFSNVKDSIVLREEFGLKCPRKSLTECECPKASLPIS